MLKHTHDENNDLIKIAIIGIFGGFFGGLLGIGGSFLVIPFLIGVIGLSAHQSHATALPVAFASGIAALVFYLTTGQINITVSIQVMIGSLVGVLTGAKLMKYVKGQLLSFLFGVFLLLLACAYFVPTDYVENIDYKTSISTVSIAVLLGIIAGLASGLFGAGGGTILVPGIVLFLHLNEHVAQGVSLLAIIPTTVLGTWMQYKENNLVMRVAPLLTIGAGIGGLAGGYLAMHTHGIILRGLLIISLLYIGIQNIVKNSPSKTKKLI